MEIDNCSVNDSSFILTLFSKLDHEEQLFIVSEIANNHSYIMDLYMKFRNIFHFENLPIDAISKVFYHISKSDFSSLIQFLWISRGCRSLLLELLPQTLCRRYGFSLCELSSLEVILLSNRMHNMLQKGRLIMTSYNSCTCIKLFSSQPASFSQLDNFVRCMKLPYESSRLIEKQYLQRVLMHQIIYPNNANISVTVILTPFFLLFWHGNDPIEYPLKHENVWYSHCFDQSVEFTYSMDFYATSSPGHLSTFHVILYANYNLYLFHNYNINKISQEEANYENEIVNKNIQMLQISSPREHLNKNVHLPPYTNVCALSNGFILAQCNNSPGHVYVYDFVKNESNQLIDIQCIHHYDFLLTLNTTLLRLPWNGAFITATLSSLPGNNNNNNNRQLTRLKLTMHLLNNGEICQSLEEKEETNYELDRLLSLPFSPKLRVLSASFVSSSSSSFSHSTKTIANKVVDNDLLEAINNYFIAVFVAP